MSSNTQTTEKQKLDILLDWKKAYIEKIINELKPKGNVLEIGFGLGFGANAIQSFKPQSHTIIESNPTVFAEVQKWADKKPHIKLVQGTWEATLPKLGKFDAIFFNDYPLESDIGIMNFLFPEDFIQTTKEAKSILSQLEKEMTSIKTHFSDEEIENFIKKVTKDHKEEVPAFFENLKKNGNISNEQLDKFLKKYHFEQKNEEIKNKAAASAPASHVSDPMLKCLEECLTRHMDKGNRFAIFLNGQVSKFEDAQFFEKIITNPDVEYKENSVSIKTNDKPRTGIIAIVEKC